VKHIIDTHAYIWLLAGDKRLSFTAKSILDNPASELFLPTLALAEIHYGHLRARHGISREQALSFAQSAVNLELLPLDLLSITLLPDQLDIHDGIIVAAGLSLKQRTGDEVGIISVDSKIIASGILTVVW
jgi:PIN domain nuclease of toxin-antitoxin system